MQKHEAVQKHVVQGLSGLPENDLAKVVNLRVADTCHELMDDEEVNRRISQSNSTGWAVDEFEVGDICLEGGECRAAITFHASGDVDDDRPDFGRELYGSATAVIDDNDDVMFEDVTVTSMK